MINPEELSKLYGDFIAGAEFEFEDVTECMLWCYVNEQFLKWLAEENRIRGHLSAAGSFEHFRRLMSADA